MNRVTITLHIDLPDGVVPDVSYGAAVNDEPPLPDAPPPDLFPVPQQVPAPVVTINNNPPVCRVHHKPMAFKPAGTSKAGKAYSAFWACSEKTDGEWCKETAKAA